MLSINAAVPVSPVQVTIRIRLGGNCLKSICIELVSYEICNSLCISRTGIINNDGFPFKFRTLFLDDSEVLLFELPHAARESIIAAASRTDHIFFIIDILLRILLLFINASDVFDYILLVLQLKI